MKIRCEYCNNYIDDSEEKCSNCGAPNANYKRVGNQVPTTIEELKQWYEDHHLPPAEVTRFFIGVDYKDPKAFGIYKDEKTGKFVVYKNKDTGERAIRYEGNDESYAVNELYLKLKEEIQNQKNMNDSNDEDNDESLIRLYHGLTILITVCMLGVFLLPAFFSYFTPDRGYYNINNKEYYYVNGNWYVYSEDDMDWEKSKKPDYSGRLDDYYDGSSYSDSYEYTDIEDSSVYDKSWDVKSSSSDWDSGSDWDSSDSWDSGSSDWGSDW